MAQVGRRKMTFMKRFIKGLRGGSDEHWGRWVTNTATRKWIGRARAHTEAGRFFLITTPFLVRVHMPDRLHALDGNRNEILPGRMWVPAGEDKNRKLVKQDVCSSQRQADMVTVAS